ncbi:hypothetical protein DFQ27_000846 [Actinomortierella ambigua]|uniref:Uncharacterized protein n=1 Tax=Actinomortierella ambigua TaxID=1343610 RepID=A0A9P6QFF6_9FUNG|nr:hypothetical protein DFQ27_000846 [Actinomortierella ambigua]
MDREKIDQYWRELVTLSRESYFLPSIVICVTIAVLFTYLQENKHVAHGAAIEESDDALDVDDAVSAAPSAKSHDDTNGTDDAKAAVKKAFAVSST